jgi:hypothetical protein
LILTISWLGREGRGGRFVWIERDGVYPKMCSSHVTDGNGGQAVVVEEKEEDKDI